MRHITDKPPALHELAPEVPMALVQITEKAMAKNPANRYQSASEMSGAIQQFKKDPDISFEYQYIVENAPERVISKVVRKTQGETTRRTVSQAGKRPAAQAQHAAPSGAESLAKHKPAQHRKGKKEFSLIPTLLGITLACVVVTVFACYHIFSSSSNVLFSNREDVVLADFVGMTRAQVEADPSYKDLKVVFDEEYDSNAEAGYVYSQMPKAGRTVKQGQKVTVKISLGTQYIAGPCSAAAAFLLNGSAENHLAIELHLLEYVHSLQHYGDACAVVKRFAGNYVILKLHRRKQCKRYIVADAHKALHLVCIKAGIANKLVYGI